MKLCKNCNNEITSKKRHHERTVFCSDYCAGRYYRKTNYSHTVYTIPKNTVGVVQELIVCVDLLKKGFEVFRAVSNSCSCDLAILKEGKLLRVEVTSGYKTKNTLIHPKKDTNKFEILAVVINGEITYQPNIEDKLCKLE